MNCIVGGDATLPYTVGLKHNSVVCTHECCEPKYGWGNQWRAGKPTNSACTAHALPPRMARILRDTKRQEYPGTCTNMRMFRS